MAKANEDVLGKLHGILAKVLSAQLSEKEEELIEAKRILLKFEQTYHKSYEEFEKELPPDADYKPHEDVVEWFFWNDVYKQAQQLVDDLRFVLGKN